MLVAGIEAGGTTFVLSVAQDSATNIVDTFEFSTGDPQPTLDTAIQWLSKFELSAIGIAMFGPVDINTSSATYGYVTSTPKAKWRNFDVIGYLRERMPSMPIGLQSDVNAAALAEILHGGHGPISCCCYITVGTGVGAGICVDSKPLVGFSHPEAGHLFVRRHPDDVASGFEGVCCFHGGCVEGMACAPAIAARAGLSSAAEIPSLRDDDSVWQVAGWYLGELCASLTLVASPHVIVLGGGVLKRREMFDIIRRQCSASLAGYVDLPCNVENYIVPTKIKASAGVVGSLVLGFQAFEKEKKCH